MKKLCLMAALVLMLSGCGKTEIFETMSDRYVIPEETPIQPGHLMPLAAAVIICIGAVALFLKKKK